MKNKGIYIKLICKYLKIIIIVFNYLQNYGRALDGWKAKILTFGEHLTLIKSLLSSFPIYTLASTIILKTVIRQLERLMSNFLWNVHGASCTQWIRWSEICTPISEGGLGVLGLEQVKALLQAKLMWIVMRGDSFWAKFARAKYFTIEEPSDASQASPLWRSVLKHYLRLSWVSRWIVKRCTRRFWMDNWLGELLQGIMLVDATLSISARLGIIADLWHLIPSHPHQEIRKISLSHNQDDQLIFMLSNNGSFLTQNIRYCYLNKGSIDVRLSGYGRPFFLLILPLFFGRQCNMLYQ